MKKIDNSKIYIIIAAVIVCILVALVIRYSFNQRNIQAFVSPTEVYVNEEINYSDSTIRAEKWTWEFGNGDVSFGRQGTYQYDKPGMYQVRLTVDEIMQKEFYVNVREVIKIERDTLVKIVAQDVALQGEMVSFKGEGIAKEWRWSFGETKMTDARTQTAIYTYSEPGIYQVELTTDNTEYPVLHTIEILEDYDGTDPETELILMGNDIREKLQNIADGKSFNSNYNYILSKYLCGKNHQTQVNINNNKFNDFYSYCQGLKLTGKDNTTIVEVKVVMTGELPNQCVQKLVVSQYSADN